MFNTNLEAKHVRASQATLTQKFKRDLACKLLNEIWLNAFIVNNIIVYAKNAQVSIYWAPILRLAVSALDLRASASHRCWCARTLVSRWIVEELGWADFGARQAGKTQNSISFEVKTN